MQINFVFNWLPIFLHALHSPLSIFVSYRRMLFHYCNGETMRSFSYRCAILQYFDSDRQRLSRIVYRVVAQSKFVIPYCYHSFLYRAFHFPIAGAGAIEKAKLSSTATNEKWMRKKKYGRKYTERKKMNARSNEINQFHFYLNVMSFLWIEIS